MACVGHSVLVLCVAALAALATLVDLAAAAGPELNVTEQEDTTGWSWRLPHTAVAVLKECLSPNAPSSDTGSCLKTVTLRAMDRIARAHKQVHLGAGLVLVPDQKELARSEADHPTPRASSLDEMLGNRLISLLQGYSVRLQLPSTRVIREAISPAIASAAAQDASSARRRNNGLGSLLMMGSSLLPLKMSLLALLVGKALMLSTLAFAIPALRLLQGGGGGGEVVAGAAAAAGTATSTRCLWSWTARALSITRDGSVPVSPDCEDNNWNK